jgi:hypothetical protein
LHLGAGSRRYSSPEPHLQEGDVADPWAVHRGKGLGGVDVAEHLRHRRGVDRLVQHVRRFFYAVVRRRTGLRAAGAARRCGARAQAAAPGRPRGCGEQAGGELRAHETRERQGAGQHGRVSTLRGDVCATAARWGRTPRGRGRDRDRALADLPTGSDADARKVQRNGALLGGCCWGYAAVCLFCCARLAAGVHRCCGFAVARRGSQRRARQAHHTAHLAQGPGKGAAARPGVAPSN